MAKRKKPEPAPRAYDRLALYNAERDRGIAHTPEWDERMAKVQARFDEDIAQEAGWTASEYIARQRHAIGLKPVDEPTMVLPGTF